MKRTALILLTIVYLVSTLGVSVNSLYCYGKLVAVNYTLGSSDHTGEKPEKKKDDCCKSVKQSFKVKDNHFSTASVSLIHSAPVILSRMQGFELQEIVRALPAISPIQANAPPGVDLVPLYTLNCTYRI